MIDIVSFEDHNRIGVDVSALILELVTSGAMMYFSTYRRNESANQSRSTYETMIEESFSYVLYRDNFSTLSSIASLVLRNAFYVFDSLPIFLYSHEKE